MTVEEFLAQFDEWDADRSELAEAENECRGGCCVDWSDSDDEAVTLLYSAIEFIRNQVAGFACAECGTTAARTYVVTTLDPSDSSTRTEVCLDCHGEIA